jgi:hypothetical protein
VRWSLCIPVILSDAGVQKVQDTVSKLCDEHQNLSEGLKVLNIGFGLGIVRYQSSIFRNLFSSHNQVEHHRSTPSSSHCGRLHLSMLSSSLIPTYYNV